MSNSLKRILKVLIIILIPVISAVLMGVYGYNFYNKDYVKREFEGTLYEDVKQDTISEIEAFFSFNQDRFNKTPYYESEVKGSDLGSLNGNSGYGVDEKLFTLRIYQALYYGEKTVYSQGVGTTVSEDLSKYIIVLYDVNYDGLCKIFGKDYAKYGAPELELYFNPTNSEFDGQAFTLSVASGNYRPCDYNKLPAYTAEELENIDKSKNSTFTTIYMYEWLCEANRYDFGMDFKMQIRATVDLDEDGEEQADKVVLTEVFNGQDKKFTREFDESDLSDLVKGSKGDHYVAGFNSYVFSHYIWWISLITFVVVLGLTYLFVMIWSVEEVETASPKRKKIK